MILSPTARAYLRVSSSPLERAFSVPFPTANLARRLHDKRDLMEFWVAEADGAVICAGQLELVPGTALAGIWGDGTVPE
ncbi:hypothetical protein ACMT4L_06800 [Deinococcus sp. A31D244]|uniref:hypothetical protein n=1 Tax=Deinococcus sp. A31D244 TaxID=3397675 RepID=UPI0039E18B24